MFIPIIAKNIKEPLSILLSIFAEKMGLIKNALNPLIHKRMARRTGDNNTHGHITRKGHFTNSTVRQTTLYCFLNLYNTVKPYKGLNGMTPYEILEFYFSQKV